MVVLHLQLISDVYELMKHETRILQRDMHWGRSQEAMHGEDDPCSKDQSKGGIAKVRWRQYADKGRRKRTRISHLGVITNLW
jgi:hypothetical protein